MTKIIKRICLSIFPVLPLLAVFGMSSCKNGDVNYTVSFTNSLNTTVGADSDSNILLNNEPLYWQTNYPRVDLINSECSSNDNSIVTVQFNADWDTYHIGIKAHGVNPGSTLIFVTLDIILNASGTKQILTPYINVTITA